MRRQKKNDLLNTLRNLKALLPSIGRMYELTRDQEKTESYAKVLGSLENSIGTLMLDLGEPSDDP